MTKLNINTLSCDDVVIYGDNKIGLFSDIKHLAAYSNKTFFIDGIVVGLVKNGIANLTINDDVCKLTVGDMFACSPNNIIEGSMVSMDFEIHVVFFSKEYTRELADMAGIDWSFHAMAQSHETIHFSDDEIKMFNYGFSFLRDKIKSEDSPYKSKCIDNLILSMIYDAFDKRKPSDEEVRTRTFSPQENILHRFLTLLEDSNPLKNPNGGFLSVNEYASQLYITPKYFSTICKRLTGKTAGQIIGNEIIRTAKILLHDDSKSIQQISSMLGFANQSHFGTYFRRITGVSPQNFRNTM